MKSSLLCYKTEALKMTNEETLEYLKGIGYLHPRILPDGRFATVLPLLYTAAIVVGSKDEARFEYSDRWCYHDIQAATKALEAWNGEGEEPTGWHRHPDSGRRRDLETGREWINP